MTASLSTQPTTPAISVTDLRQMVAGFQAAHPGAACRIERGARLVAAGAVSPVYGIGHLVASASEPGRSYWVQLVDALWTCECPDYRERQVTCKHGWAAVLFAAAERLDAEQGDPTLGPIPYQLTSKALAALTVRKPGDAA